MVSITFLNHNKLYKLAMRWMLVCDEEYGMREEFGQLKRSPRIFKHTHTQIIIDLCSESFFVPIWFFQRIEQFFVFASGETLKNVYIYIIFIFFPFLIIFIYFLYNKFILFAHFKGKPLLTTVHTTKNIYFGLIVRFSQKISLKKEQRFQIPRCHEFQTMGFVTTLGT